MNHRQIACSLIFLFAAIALSAYDGPGIDRFKAVFDNYPSRVPTGMTVDAPVTGNGDIGLTMAPSAGKVVFYVGKNDFWKAVESYPDGKVALPGGLTITSDIFKEGEYHAEQLPGSARIDASFKTDDNELSLSAWVPALENKVVIELEALKPVELDLELWTPEGSGSVTDRGEAEGRSWVSRSFQDLEYLRWPTRMTMAMNLVNGKVTLQPGAHLVVVLTIYTSHDTYNWHEKALKEASSVTEESIEKARRQHREWWDSFWSLSGISMADEFLEKYYYQSQYIFACSTREGKFAPGLWGPFITSDSPGWAGDYHLNYNYEGPYWASYSSNHISLTENYDQPLLDYMDQGREHAWNLFKCRGILYPVGLGPMGLCSSAWPKNQEDMKRYGGAPNTIEDGAMFWQQKTNASFAASNMLMRFYSTYDKEYARKIYPYVLACADFWEDYLVLEDGRYVIKGDVFNETPPWIGYEGDFNCVMSLGLARMTFVGVDALSRFLKVDRNRRRKWKEILDKLSDFPVGIDDEGKPSLMYREKEGDKPSGISRLHMHGVLLPTGLTGPVSTPEYNKVMLDDLHKWKASEWSDWGSSMSNGIETVYPGAARIGFPARELLERLRDRILRGSYPNCYIHAGGGGIETLSAVPGTINEMMMQSYEGVIRIFPNWDRGMDGSFNDLRAYGAFLVSSSMKDGEIGAVTVKSEKGRRCKVENPWPDKAVRLYRNGKPRGKLKGKTLEFRTRKGEVLELLVI